MPWISRSRLEALRERIRRAEDDAAHSKERLYDREDSINKIVSDLRDEVRRHRAAADGVSTSHRRAWVNGFTAGRDGDLRSLAAVLESLVRSAGGSA